MMDLFAWWFAHPANAAERLRRLAGALKKRPEKVTLRQINLRDIAGEADKIRAIYNQAWARNWVVLVSTISPIGSALVG